MTENGVTKMLTALDVQGMLQIDRSTVYRMADDGRLPAIKVGKQWRFPADQIQQWFQAQTTMAAVPVSSPTQLPGFLPWSASRIE